MQCSSIYPCPPEKVGINVIEIMKSILDNKFKKSFSMVMQYPFSLKKIKLVIALLLPNFILRRIKNYWYVKKIIFEKWNQIDTKRVGGMNCGLLITIYIVEKYYILINPPKR